MSGTTLRTIITLVFLFHGIGHIMGIIPATGLIDLENQSQDWLRNWSSHSWLLTDTLGDSVSRILCIVLYAAGLIGFVGAGLALTGLGIPHEWWRPLTLLAAVVSILAVVLFWNALIFLVPHKVGAMAVNIGALVALLALNWPTEAAIGY